MLEYDINFFAIAAVGGGATNALAPKTPVQTMEGTHRFAGTIVLQKIELMFLIQSLSNLTLDDSGSVVVIVMFSWSHETAESSPP